MSAKLNAVFHAVVWFVLLASFGIWLYGVLFTWLLGIDPWQVLYAGLGAAVLVLLVWRHRILAGLLALELTGIWLARQSFTVWHDKGLAIGSLLIAAILTVPLAVGASLNDSEEYAVRYRRPTAWELKSDLVVSALVLAAAGLIRHYADHQSMLESALLVLFFVLAWFLRPRNLPAPR